MKAPQSSYSYIPEPNIWSWVFAIGIHGIVLSLLYLELPSYSGIDKKPDSTEEVAAEVKALRPSRLIKVELPSKSANEAATDPRAYRTERSTSAIATSKSDEEADLKMPDPKEKQHIPDGVDTEEGTDAPGIRMPDLAQWQFVRWLIERGHAAAEIELSAGGKIILFQGKLYKTEGIYKQAQVSRRGWTLPAHTQFINYVESKATTSEVTRNFRLRLSVSLDERLLDAQKRFARKHGLNLEAIRWTQFKLSFGIGDEINFAIVEAQTDDGNHIRADASGSTGGAQ